MNNHSLESDGQDPNCCSPKTNYLVRSMRTWIMLYSLKTSGMAKEAGKKGGSARYKSNLDCT